MKTSLVIRELRRRALALDALYEQIANERNAMNVVITMLENEENGVTANSEPNHGDMVTDTIEQILTQEQPLHRSVILERVQGAGVHIGGSMPLNSISSYLSTDPRFKVAGRGMWGLVERPIRPTEYEVVDQNGKPMLEGLESPLTNTRRIADGVEVLDSIAS